MAQRYESYIIDIEVDADSGGAVLTKGNFTQYFYTVEELEGFGIIPSIQASLEKVGSQGTVYSQNQTFTLDEYLSMFGSLHGLGDAPDYLRY